MNHVKSASDFINKLKGINLDNAQLTSIVDQVYFRNLNMNIATLKEISVAYDNTLSIMSVYLVEELNIILFLLL